MSATIAGTFTGLGQCSGQLPPGPTGGVVATQLDFKLTTIGLDASNTLKTQKSTNNGLIWADVTTYNSDQTGVLITVAEQEHWRLCSVAIQTSHDLKYKMSREGLN